MMNSSEMKKNKIRVFFHLFFVKNILINDDFLDLYTQINEYIRPLEVIHGGIRGRLGRVHPTGNINIDRIINKIRKIFPIK